MISIDEIIKLTNEDVSFPGDYKDKILAIGVLHKAIAVFQELEERLTNEVEADELFGERD